MLPPSIVVRLAENVRTCRAQLDEAEATAGEIRAEYNGYLELLTYAESQTEQVAPALWDSSLEEDRDPAAWCDCAAPTNSVLVHGIGRCIPREASPMPTVAPLVEPEPPTSGAAWCACGFPGVGGIGVAHGITECTSGNPSPMPAAPAPGSLAAFRRGFFAPHVPSDRSDVGA